MLFLSHRVCRIVYSCLDDPASPQRSANWIICCLCRHRPTVAYVLFDKVGPLEFNHQRTSERLQDATVDSLLDFGPCEVKSARAEGPVERDASAQTSVGSVREESQDRLPFKGMAQAALNRPRSCCLCC